MYKEILNNLSTEFKPKFESAGLSFETVYSNTYSSVLTIAGNNTSQDVIEAAIKTTLEDILLTYANSKSKTDTGGFFRRLARTASKLVKYINLDKLFKKQ